MLKKMAGWIFIGFLIFYVAYHPASAANTAKSVGSKAMEVGSGFGDFFTSLLK